MEQHGSPEVGGRTDDGRSPGEPLVSVLLACFDHERYVERALDSAATQTYGNIEIIIVDDCSTDGSVARIEEWLGRTEVPVRFVANTTNVGICAVLNRLLAMASGEYFVQLDTDDWLEPDRVQRHVDRFATLGPEVAVVYSDVNLVDADGAPTGESFLERHLRGRERPADDEMFDALLLENFLPTPGATIRRSAVLDVGGYDESLAYDDYDMWLRLGRRFEFAHCEGRVANYRMLASSMSHSAAWRPRIDESIIRILVGWAGTEDVRSSATRRRAVASQLRSHARGGVPGFPGCARRALVVAEELAPSFRWRCVQRARVLSWPFGPRLLGATAGIIRRVRAPRRSRGER